ncbi:hypothetical protein [Janthinobacterium fluminis]|uniref:Uncharacterized protein n=1 Tax=Janthinobacterium fluminis TaxID=2987524 RepID=A0ABT5K4I6_9BURK|nr:hypothetical protein [Janthinobacterium fluminis]MDC8759909.1 hypothetical protein [Janthinobacterium fluminis]
MRTFNQPQGKFTIYDPGYVRVAADVSTPARAAAVTFEETIRRDSNETGAFFRPNGAMITKRSGQPDQVRFPSADLVGTAGGLFTHNHPSGLSFSSADVESAAGLGLSEVRAVSPGYRHIMTPVGNWPTESAIQRAYHIEIQAAQADVDKMVRAGELSVSYATVEIHHRVWELVSAKLGLNYIREAS